MEASLAVSPCAGSRVRLQQKACICKLVLRSSEVFNERTGTSMETDNKTGEEKFGLD